MMDTTMSEPPTRRTVHRAVRVYDRARITHELRARGYDALVGKYPLTVLNPIARHLGLIEKYHRRPHPSREWDSAWNVLLGTMPDADLGAQLGVPGPTVSRARQLLGIAPSGIRERKRAERDRQMRRIPTQELLDLTIKELVAKYEVPAIYLITERTRRNVVPEKRQGVGSRGLRTHIADMRRAGTLAIRIAYPEATLQDIALAFGITRERARQLWLDVKHELEEEGIE